MCGIAGLLSRRGEAHALQRMPLALNAMARRGPNDRGSQALRVPDGTLVLGHTRLSIIDLSAAGHQPMQSADARYIIVFNGEIYNYRELAGQLAAEGVTLRTQTDTEVLLAAWARWGTEALPRLIGMFAFAVFDRNENSLTCVRDAFGIKPLFYACEGKNFLFASDIPALKTLKEDAPALDWQSAYDYLAHGEYDASAASFIDGVRQLQPGHLLRLTSGDPTPRVTRWWSPSIAPLSTLTFADAASALREKFLASVRLHLRSDVALGAALSGGLDSSAIVCAMRYLEPDAPIHTFSFIARGSPLSEEHWVDLIGTRLHATTHKIEVAPEELVRDLDDLIATQGEPFGSTSIYAQYRVFRLAKEQGITVTLDGQGADELLAGYQGYPGQRIRSLIEEGHYAKAASFLRHWTRWPGRSLGQGAKALAGQYTGGWAYDCLRQISGSRLRPAWLRGAILDEHGVKTRFPPHRAQGETPGRRVAAELADAISQRGLPALLRHGDRNSMRFSVESRVPFLTPALADFLLTLPEHFLISSQGETKCILRAALRGIVPDEILKRRDKVGFATPELQWLRQMAPAVREWLREDTGLPFLDQPRILAEFDAMIAGRRPFSWQAWRWINFTRWYNRHMAS